MDTRFRGGSPTAMVLSGLASLMKKHSMYPSGHPTVDRALDLLMLQFEQYFQNRPAMVIGVGYDRLSVDGEERAGDEASSTLSRLLHGHSVAQLVFHQGMGRNELMSFMRTLDVDPFEARETGGYRRLLALKGITSIEIAEIDYRLADGDISAKLDGLTDADVWRKLSRGWSEGRKNVASADLEFLRGLIHNGVRAAGVLDGALGRAADREEADQTVRQFLDLIASMTAEVEVEGDEARELFLSDVLRMLEVLNPVSRFVVMRRLIVRDVPLIGGQSVISVLTRINPRLLVRSLFEGLHPDYSTDEEFIRVFSTFVGRNNEVAVITEFSSMVRDYDLRHDTRFAQKTHRAERLRNAHPALKRLAETVSGKQGVQIARELPVYEYIENMYGEMNDVMSELTDASMEGRSTDNLAELLEIARNSETYEFYALGMDERIQWLLETGRYGLAARAIRTLRQHASKKNENEKSRAVARALILRLRRPETADELVRAMNEWGKEEGQSIAQILEALGPAAWDAVFEALTREINRSARALLVDVLAGAGPKCADKAKAYLEHPLWYVVRNMVAVLSRLEPDNLSEILAAPARHTEARVRKEVARALSVARDEDAADILMRMVSDPDTSVRHQAILGLAHFQDYARAAEFLILELGKKPPFGGDEQSELLALKALGAIRVKSAIPALSHYVNGSLLSRINESLVAAAAEALSKFEGAEAIGALVRGSKSWNKSVKQICGEWLRQRGLPE